LARITPPHARIWFASKSTLIVLLLDFGSSGSCQYDEDVAGKGQRGFLIRHWWLAEAGSHLPQSTQSSTEWGDGMFDFFDKNHSLLILLE
jgi:hypothetical protein